MSHRAQILHAFMFAYYTLNSLSPLALVLTNPNLDRWMIPEAVLLRNLHLINSLIDQNNRRSWLSTSLDMHR